MRLTFRRPYIPPRTMRPQTYQLSEPSFTPLYFSASMGPRSPSGGGNMVQLLIRNPANSGTALVIQKLVLWSQALRDVVGILGASSDLATTISITSRKQPSEFPSARVTTNNSTLAVVPTSGINFRHPLEGNTPWTYDQILILRPGTSFEVRFPDLSSTATDVYNADVDWYEISDAVVT